MSSSRSQIHDGGVIHAVFHARESNYLRGTIESAWCLCSPRKPGHGVSCAAVVATEWQDTASVSLSHTANVRRRHNTARLHSERVWGSSVGPIAPGFAQIADVLVQDRAPGHADTWFLRLCSYGSEADDSVYCSGASIYPVCPSVLCPIQTLSIARGRVPYLQGAGSYLEQ